MNIIQYVFSVILNIIYIITKRINNKVRDALLGVSLFLIMLLFMLTTMKKDFGFKVEDTFGSTALFILICLVIVFSVDRKMTTYKIDLKYVVSWTIIFAFALIAGIIHPVGDGVLLQVVEMLILFPLLAFVWNNRGDYQYLFSLISKIYLSLVAVAFIVCLMVKPITIINGIYRYYGFTSNPNVLGFHSVIGALCAIYLIFTEKEFKVLYYIALIMNFGMLYYSMARASLLGFILAVIFGIVIFAKNKVFVEKKVITGLSIIAIIIISIVFAPTIVFHTVEATSSLTTEVFAETETDASVDALENQALEQRFSLEGKDFNAITSGRYNIWCLYWPRLSVLGNDTSDNFYIDSVSLNTTAHNIYLEYGYRFGLVSAIALIVFMLSCMFYAVKLIVSKRTIKEYEYFSVMMIAAFFMISLVESVYIPSKYIVFFCFCLAVMPLFRDNKEQVTEDKRNNSKSKTNNKAKKTMSKIFQNKGTHSRKH